MAPSVHHAIEEGMFVRARRGATAGSIVLVHGLGESGLCFEHLFAHGGLATLNLFAPDLPGYGRSAWIASPESLAAHADRLATWIRRTEPPRPLALVGHSMGGVIGILLAERHAALLDVLVNVDGNLSPGDCVFSGRAVEFGLEDFLAGGFERLRDTVYRQGARECAQRGYYASMRLADPRQFHRHSRELVELSAAEDLALRMVRLEVASHYVAGVPRGACRRSRELLDEAGAAWTAIEPSGHWPFVDQPDAFVRTLVTLLS